MPPLDGDRAFRSPGYVAYITKANVRGHDGAVAPTPIPHRPRVRTILRTLTVYLSITSQITGLSSLGAREGPRKLPGPWGSRIAKNMLPL